MSELLTDMSCSDFADAIAAKTSVPGGGAVAAYAGAMGAALCSMVGEFTTGKKRYAEYEEDVQRMLVEAEEVRRTLVGLVDADAEAFEPLSKAYGIPKDDPNRAGIVEAATKTACAAPMEMMRQCAKTIELLEEMEQKGSRMLLSDVGCGAAMAGAALQSASMNVTVNTKTLLDRDYANKLDDEVDELLGTYVPRANAIVERVSAKLRG